MFSPVSLFFFLHFDSVKSVSIVLIYNIISPSKNVEVANDSPFGSTELDYLLQLTYSLTGIARERW
jgi:hypothetical protein